MRPMPDVIPSRSRRSPTGNRARWSVSSSAQRYNAPASPVQSALLASGRPANDHLEDGRVQRLGKGAAELRPFRPGDARMEGFQPRQLEPDVGARLQEKVRANPEAMRGEVEHFDGDAARPARTETGFARDLGSQGPASPGRNPGGQV